MQKFVSQSNADVVTATNQAQKLSTVRTKFNELKKIDLGNLNEENCKRIEQLGREISNELCRLLSEARSKNDQNTVNRMEFVMHDLVSPIAVIVSASRILSRASGLDSKTREEMLSALKTNIEYFDKLLTFQEDEEKPAVLDLKALLEKSINQETLRRSSGYATKLTYEGEGFKINAGEIAMYRVFKNLITNAAKAHAKEITVEFQKPLVKVIDNGEGMPQQLAENLFNPFYIIKDAEGARFGCKIVREQLDKINATIKVESEVGKGTTIIIDFSNCCNQQFLNI